MSLYFLRSSLLKTVPVGLHGELNIIALVFLVMVLFSCSTDGLKSLSMEVFMYTGTPSAKVIIAE